MHHRTSYDTSVKHLYRRGLEEAIPLSLRKTIPRNTIHRWRKEKDDKYIGCELNKLANSEIEMLKEFIKSLNLSAIIKIKSKLIKNLLARQAFKWDNELSL